MVAPVSVIITRYDEPDALVQRALASVTAQEGVDGELIFVDQATHLGHPAEQLANANWSVRVLEVEPQGLSHARNTGLTAAEHETVLFLDPDAHAGAGWAAALSDALAQPGICIAGTRIEPDWERPPTRLSRLRLVRDQYSLFDLGRDRRPATRVVGASFGLRRDRCTAEMRFDEGVGRRDGRLFSGEETELCRRILAAGGGVLYDGSVAVEHLVPAARMRLSWILRRFFYTGESRGRLGGAPGGEGGLTWADRLSLPLLLPPYALGWIWGRWRRGR